MERRRSYIPQILIECVACTSTTPGLGDRVNKTKMTPTLASVQSGGKDKKNAEKCNAEFDFKNCLSTNTMGMKVSVLIQEYTQMWEDLDTWRKESQKVSLMSPGSPGVNEHIRSCGKGKGHLGLPKRGHGYYRQESIRRSSGCLQ